MPLIMDTIDTQMVIDTAAWIMLAIGTAIAAWVLYDAWQDGCDCQDGCMTCQQRQKQKPSATKK